MKAQEAWIHEQLKTSVTNAVHLYILVLVVSGTSSSCLPPDFGLHLEKIKTNSSVTVQEDFGSGQKQNLHFTFQNK